MGPNDREGSLWAGQASRDPKLKSKCKSLKTLFGLASPLPLMTPSLNLSLNW
uniref:Uncharacterized protein n=1 Tax=Cucumis melo TaxID=3656 RepID=A0A9I9CCU4_CUCME